MKLKKLFTSMAVTALAIGSMFMTAMADGSFAHLIIGDTDYDVSTDQSGTGWSWDVDTRTLTLNGYDGASIYLSSDFTSVVNLVIEGENTVSADNSIDAIYLASALGEYTVSGGGVLTVKYADEDAISFASFENGDGRGSATISDVTINIEDAGYGFYANSLTFDGVTVNVGADFQYTLIDGCSIYDDETDTDIRGNLEVIDSDFDLAIDIGDYDVSLIGNFETVTFEGSTVDLLYTVVEDAEPYMSFIEYVDSVVINDSDFNLATETAEGVSSNSYFISDFETSVDVADSSITVSNWGSIFGMGNSEESTVTVTDSEITGDAIAPFGIFAIFKVQNSLIDLETMASMFVMTFEVIDSKVTLVAAESAFVYVENLNITDSEVYFENIEATGFQIESEGDEYGFVNYTFTYTTPEFWGLYLDGELSEDYTVESTDIVFGEKILEIRYVHECTFDEYVSDGADTHTSTCECGETDTVDHTWDEGVVTKEAAVDVPGETTYTCTVCGETKTEAIDALVATPEVTPEATPEDVEPADPTQPDTGDNGIVALVGLMLLAGAGVAVASKKRA